MTDEKLWQNVIDFENNMVHKTKYEKINGVREILVDLANLNWSGEIGRGQIDSILGKVNQMLLRINDSLED